MASTLSLIILCKILVHVQGWGTVGHSIIAQLAQSELTGSASNRVRDLIPWHYHGNLSAMASWADSIIHENTNPTGFDNWHWSRALHYINIPDWNCSYRVERDCLNDICVDGAVRNYSKRLETDLDDIQHQEALYFLIHFVGDLHQPLHVAFTSDSGGNNVKGRFMNKTGQTNLHSIWDTEIISYRIQHDFNSSTSRYYEHIYQLMHQQSSTANDNDVRQWIKESVDYICQEIYYDDNNKIMNATIRFNLGEKYYRRSWLIIEQRLAQGGRRLGALLNRIVRIQTVTTTKEKLCIGTYVLIAVLAAEFLLAVAVGICCCIRYINK